MTNSNYNSEGNPIDPDSFKTMAARVDKVNIDGVSRTKDDLLINMSKQLFSVTNFEELIKKSMELQQSLINLNCFKDIQVHVDTSKGEGKSENGYEITYKVTENRRIFGGINTFVGNNNDGCVAVNVNFPNIAGRGEFAQIMYQYGTQKTTGISVDFLKPIAPWSLYDPKIMASIFQNASDFPWSGFREVDRGAGVDLKLKYSPNMSHTLRWEGIWRDISALSGGTAFAVREESGHTLKSSIKHILTLDQREGGFIPMSGTFFQLKQEYAGVGGNIKFHKHEIEVQNNLPIRLIEDAVLQGTFRAGIMKSVTRSCITDRFFIGGPLSVRGFEINGLGPHSEGNALGANTYWVANLHFYCPLPFQLGKNSFSKYVRSHLFLNSGNIGNFNLTGDYYRDTSLLFDKIRYSIGAGIVINIPSGARIEFHCCLPLYKQSTDRPDKGLQFGVGAQFV